MKSKNAKAQALPNMEGEGKEKTQELAGQENELKQKPQFISVPVDVVGKYKGKNYVELKGIGYSPESGNLSLHLNDKDTLLFKSGFQSKFMGIVVKSTEKEERSVKSAPVYDKSQMEKSNARLKLMGDGDGRSFYGVTGAVRYDGSFRGLVVNLDDKHVTIVDSKVLSKELGITISPIAMEKNIGLSR